MDNEVAETLIRLSDRALTRSLFTDTMRTCHNTFRETELFVAESLVTFYPLDECNPHCIKEYRKSCSESTREASDDCGSEDDVEMTPSEEDEEVWRSHPQRATSSVHDTSLKHLYVAACYQRMVSKPIILREERSPVKRNIKQKQHSSPTSIENAHPWSIHQQRRSRLGSMSSSEEESENGGINHRHLKESIQMGNSSNRRRLRGSLNFGTLDDSVHINRHIGSYSPIARKKRIERFLEKRKRRVWAKKVDYDVRKKFANSRLRVKGRFVKKEDEELLCRLLSFT
uniref:Uncharacterized protein AlNc14C95G5850 n=1 Tax=Albugo laibachii Nc14 TaxID=890382 RepID=F0WGX4_9STRA|nr:conserved hypothetical protein [Albugo laibachii Nc14]|eukprot:CCA20489.1 conserved hypothetical protein [Albugo laibachii Nc14]